VWTAVAGAAMVAVTLPFVGVDAYLEYLRVLRNVSGVTGVLNNHDLSTTVQELRLPQPLPELALIAGYATALLAMVVSLRRDRELSLVVTLGGTLLLSPLLWDHYLVSLLIPAAFLASRGRTWGLLIPVAAWLPWVGVFPLLALAGVLLPFLAPAPADAQPGARESATTGNGRTLRAATAS
jgi:hypothetical protein